VKIEEFVLLDQNPTKASLEVLYKDFEFAIGLHSFWLKLNKIVVHPELNQFQTIMHDYDIISKIVMHLQSDNNSKTFRYWRESADESDAFGCTTMMERHGEPWNLKTHREVSITVETIYAPSHRFDNVMTEMGFESCGFDPYFRNWKF
jgi:hypothetical protein